MLEHHVGLQPKSRNSFKNGGSSLQKYQSFSYSIGSMLVMPPMQMDINYPLISENKNQLLNRNRDSGSKNGGSSLQKYQAFSYSIGDASDENWYKWPPKYRKIRINFA